ncbi:MAG: hypothetical protein WBF90_33935 [Rivularia sp. (in: cyanobacteria)]
MGFEERYGKGYSRICAIAHKRTNQLCCCCLSAKSEEIHHALYGFDVIGWSIFPVCKECHTKICHNKENWIVDEDNPVWNNRNNLNFLKKLRDNYLQARSIN